jgi:hypothetical protein
MSRLDDEVQRLRQIVNEYSATRAPSQEPLEVRGPFDRVALWKSEFVKKPGCYVIYGEDGSFKYTGMSEVGVGSRIGSHLGPAEQASAFWQKGPPASYFCLIATPAWEAPGLEAFLRARGYYYQSDVPQ